MRSSCAISSPSSMNALRARYSGRAPATARSFTVPCTASEPMSPPGNSSGCTVKPSVVKTSLAVGGRQRHGVGLHVEQGVRQMAGEHPFDQLAHEAAAVAVRERHARRFEFVVAVRHV